jgi:hypothetical protein
VYIQPNTFTRTEKSNNIGKTYGIISSNERFFLQSNSVQCLHLNNLFTNAELNVTQEIKTGLVIVIVVSLLRRIEKWVTACEFYNFSCSNDMFCSENAIQDSVCIRIIH